MSRFNGQLRDTILQDRMQKKTHSSNAMKLTVLGASLAGLAATAYFFLGPKGKKHQRHAKAWVVKMKAEVIEKLEKARDITEPVYHEIIDTVAKEYEKGKKAGGEEIAELVKDLKKHWKTMSRAAKNAKREVSKSAERIAEKAGL